MNNSYSSNQVSIEPRNQQQSYQTVWFKKKKPFQAAISTLNSAMTAQLRTCTLSRRPGRERAWPGLQEECGLWGQGGHQGWLWEIPDYRSNPMVLHWWQANRQWAMCWLRWVWGGGRLTWRGRADRTDSGRRYIPDGERWVLPVVTLCL